ncbi:hypothetical protein HK098_003070 [Nowakowskiella sp. JEL0407]|nr:hypothetical protein HK098_003070 [Nowakowskiella sp. JEL0407]
MALQRAPSDRVPPPLSPDAQRTFQNQYPPQQQYRPPQPMRQNSNFSQSSGNSGPQTFNPHSFPPPRPYAPNPQTYVPQQQYPQQQGYTSNYVPYNPRAPPQNAYNVPYQQNQYDPNYQQQFPPQTQYVQAQRPPSHKSQEHGRPWLDSNSDSSDGGSRPLQVVQQPLVQEVISPTSSQNRRPSFPSLKRGTSRKPNVPNRSYAFDAPDDATKRTNKGNTRAVMTMLADMWLIHMIVIFGLVYVQTFMLWNYDDELLWNWTCYYKLGWLLPTPYTIICLFGLIMPYRTPRFLYHDKLAKRRCDNLYILTVTRGNNREAVYRSWNAHRHLERIHPSVRVHVLTDEPYFFENINCYTCPKTFATAKSKYKARALEWYRQTMAYTEFDWILHLDEESVIDDESVRRVLEYIWYETDMHMGQGPILYNQYRYWKNWIFTVADALRVGDDLSRFHLQLTYIKRPIWGCHGSFLLVNGLVENAVTWDLGSLTEDYEFAMAAWKYGFKVGKIPAFIREQSPQGVLDFMKQRRRWFGKIPILYYS